MPTSIPPSRPVVEQREASAAAGAAAPSCDEALERVLDLGAPGSAGWAGVAAEASVRSSMPDRYPDPRDHYPAAELTTRAPAD